MTKASSTRLVNKGKAFNKQKSDNDLEYFNKKVELRRKKNKAAKKSRRKNRGK